jgi:hypothetical protein
MKKVINKELNKTETEAHGATAMTNTKNTEKETTTIEQPIVNRVGEMTYIDTKNIQSLSSLRLGEDTTQQSKDHQHPHGREQQPCKNIQNNYLLGCLI